MHIVLESKIIDLKLSKTCPIMALWPLENFLSHFEVQYDQKKHFLARVGITAKSAKNGICWKNIQYEIGSQIRKSCWSIKRAGEKPSNPLLSGQKKYLRIIKKICENISKKEDPL